MVPGTGQSRVRSAVSFWDGGKSSFWGEAMGDPQETKCTPSNIWEGRHVDQNQVPEGVVWGVSCPPQRPPPALRCELGRRPPGRNE